MWFVTSFLETEPTSTPTKDAEPASKPAKDNLSYPTEGAIRLRVAYIKLWTQGYVNVSDEVTRKMARQNAGAFPATSRSVDTTSSDASLMDVLFRSILLLARNTDVTLDQALTELVFDAVLPALQHFMVMHAKHIDAQQMAQIGSIAPALAELQQSSRHLSKQKMNQVISIQSLMEQHSSTISPSQTPKSTPTLKPNRAKTLKKVDIQKNPLVRERADSTEDISFQEMNSRTFDEQWRLFVQQVSSKLGIQQDQGLEQIFGDGDCNAIYADLYGYSMSY